MGSVTGWGWTWNGVEGVDEAWQRSAPATGALHRGVALGRRSARGQRRCARGWRCVQRCRPGGGVGLAQAHARSPWVAASAWGASGWRAATAARSARCKVSLARVVRLWRLWRNGMGSSWGAQPGRHPTRSDGRQARAARAVCAGVHGRVGKGLGRAGAPTRVGIHALPPAGCRWLSACCRAGRRRCQFSVGPAPWRPGIGTAVPYQGMGPAGLRSAGACPRVCWPNRGRRRTMPWSIGPGG